MNLVFRLIKIVLGTFWRAPLKLLDESIVEFRVWPNDLDVNLHMNNGRYLTLMDLGRVDLVVRLGLLQHMIKWRWQPVAASATIRFRRSLKPFQKFQIRTRLVYWDEKWIYFEQGFERNGQAVARGYIKALLRDAKGNVPTAEILKAMGQDASSPPAPADVAQWQERELTAGAGALAIVPRHEPAPRA